MAPVDPLSLGPVLDLIKRWQYMNHPHWADELQALDIQALRQLAEQHAAQLREEVYPIRLQVLHAAADFLAERK